MFVAHFKLRCEAYLPNITTLALTNHEKNNKKNLENLLMISTLSAFYLHHAAPSYMIVSVKKIR